MDEQNDPTNINKHRPANQIMFGPTRCFSICLAACSVFVVLGSQSPASPFSEANPNHRDHRVVDFDAVAAPLISMPTTSVAPINQQFLSSASSGSNRETCRTPAVADAAGQYTPEQWAAWRGENQGRTEYTPEQWAAWRGENQGRTEYTAEEWAAWRATNQWSEPQPRNEQPRSKQPGQIRRGPLHRKEPLSKSTAGLLRGVSVQRESERELPGSALALEDLHHAALAFGLSYSFDPSDADHEDKAKAQYGVEILAHSKQPQYRDFQVLDLAERVVGPEKPRWFIARGLGEDTGTVSLNEGARSGSPRGATEYRSLADAFTTASASSSDAEVTSAASMQGRMQDRIFGPAWRPILQQGLLTGGMPVPSGDTADEQFLPPPPQDTLYVVFRGSKTPQDWLANFDFVTETFAEAAFLDAEDSVYGGDECYLERGEGSAEPSEECYSEEDVSAPFLDPQADDENDVILAPNLHQDYSGENLRYHKGFLRRALGSAKALHDVLLHLQGNPVRRIVVTGHSLGAAQAAVMGSLLVRGVLAKTALRLHDIDVTQGGVSVAGFSTPAILMPGDHIHHQLGGAQRTPARHHPRRAGARSDQDPPAYKAFVQAMVAKAGLTFSNNKNFIVGSDLAPRMGAVAFEMMKAGSGLLDQMNLAHASIEEFRASLEEVVEALAPEGELDFLFSLLRFVKLGKVNHMIHPGGDYILLAPEEARPCNTVTIPFLLKIIPEMVKKWQERKTVDSTEETPVPSLRDMIEEVVLEEKNKALVVVGLIARAVDALQEAPVIVRLRHHYDGARLPGDVKIWGLHETLTRLNVNPALWVLHHLGGAFGAVFAKLVEVQSVALAEEADTIKQPMLQADAAV